MIPASYMFRDTYRQHWEKAEPETAPARPAPRSGIAIPLREIIALAGQALDSLRRPPARVGQPQPDC